MKEQVEQQLQADFPFMKQDKNQGEQNTYRRWGCECSSGWYALIHDMCQAIADRYAAEGIPVDLVPLQVKEKFAALRFYYSFENEAPHIMAFDGLDGSSIRFEPGSCTQDEDQKKLRHDIAQIVRTYEEKSKSVCESCGDSTTASVRKDLPWKKTYCNSCYQRHLNYLNGQQKLSNCKDNFL